MDAYLGAVFKAYCAAIGAELQAYFGAGLNVYSPDTEMMIARLSAGDVGANRPSVRHRPLLVSFRYVAPYRAPPPCFHRICIMVRVICFFIFEMEAMFRISPFYFRLHAMCCSYYSHFTKTFRQTRRLHPESILLDVNSLLYLSLRIQIRKLHRRMRPIYVTISFVRGGNTSPPNFPGQSQSNTNA